MQRFVYIMIRIPRDLPTYKHTSAPQKHELGRHWTRTKYRSLVFLQRWSSICRLNDFIDWKRCCCRSREVFSNRFRTSNQNEWNSSFYCSRQMYVKVSTKIFLICKAGCSVIWSQFLSMNIGILYAQEWTGYYLWRFIYLFTLKLAWAQVIY